LFAGVADTQKSALFLEHSAAGTACSSIVDSFSSILPSRSLRWVWFCFRHYVRYLLAMSPRVLRAVKRLSLSNSANTRSQCSNFFPSSSSQYRCRAFSVSLVIPKIVTLVTGLIHSIDSFVIAINYSEKAVATEVDLWSAGWGQTSPVLDGRRPWEKLPD
jgi:hypothetical protein